MSTNITKKEEERRSCNGNIGWQFGSAACVANGYKAPIIIGDPTRSIEARLKSLSHFNSVSAVANHGLRNKPAIDAANSAINNMEKDGWNPEIIKRAVAGFNQDRGRFLPRRIRNHRKKYQPPHLGLQMKPAA